MKNQNKLTICICIILFVTAVILGLIFANFLILKKASITTGSIIEETEDARQEIKELLTKETITLEEKERINELVDEIVDNCSCSK